MFGTEYKEYKCLGWNIMNTINEAPGEEGEKEEGGGGDEGLEEEEACAPSSATFHAACMWSN